MTDTFATYLQHLMEPPPGGRGLTVSQIAAYADVAYTTVVNWQRGAVPKPSTLAKLARALGEDYGRLMRLAGHLPDSGADTSPRPTPTNADALPPTTREEAMLRLLDMAMPGLVRRVRVQESWAHAGDGAEGGEWVYVPPEVAGGNIQAFRVRGRCMEPEVHPGDIILADMDASPQDGDMVAVNWDGTVVVRWFDAERRQLIAEDGSAPIPADKAEMFVPVVSVTRDRGRLRKRLRNGGAK